MKHGRRIKIVIPLWIVVFVVAALPVAAQAGVPMLINYQGYLTDDSGTPLSGKQQVNFRLCSTETGGFFFWEEEQLVVVTDGVFNVQLGAVNQLFPSVFNLDTIYLEIQIFNADSVWETLRPRQQFTSTAFAVRSGNADMLEGQTLSDLDTDYVNAGEADAVTSAMIADSSITAADIQDGNGSGLDADMLDGLDASSFAPSVHNHDSRYYSKTYVDALENRIEELEAKLQYIEMVSESINGMPGPHMIIAGANLHVVNGTGSTGGAINGLGNLVVGYNEIRGQDDDRTGSHNVVIGQKHNYTSYCGIVVGLNNTISGPYASVSGGKDNTSSGQYSSISGGNANTASGDYSNVSSGWSNEASGDTSSVNGGDNNHAANIFSSVTGGTGNTASGVTSVVSAGSGNTASGDYSSVSGGKYNIASGGYAFIGGGGGADEHDGNVAFADYSSILGGQRNGTGDVTRYYNSSGGYWDLTPGMDRTIGIQTTVSGGHLNIANGKNSSVSGGYRNTASGIKSSISGGDENTASQWYSSISGGEANEASGHSASISGGAGNVVSGNYSSVSGGQHNTASDGYSSVSGGYYNEASGAWSSVSGGQSRTAANDHDWAAGSLYEQD